MSLNEIIERFTLVSGFEMQDVSRYLVILMDCKALFEERMYEGLSEAQRRRAAYACAVYAYYRISLMGYSHGVSSFKAGDVQLTTGETFPAAQQLWENERAQIGDIIRLDDDGVFRAVMV